MAQPVALLDDDALFGKDELAALEKIHGPGLTIRQYAFRRFVYTSGSRCWGCEKCDAAERAAIGRLIGDEWLALCGHMILCPDCGNKRCPRATHHANPCSGSNDSGQPGSSYQ